MDAYQPNVLIYVIRMTLPEKLSMCATFAAMKRSEKVSCAAKRHKKESISKLTENSLSKSL